MNDTIQLLLNHRSIRAFTDQQLSKEQVDTLIQAAQHAPTCNFFQQYSIIDITDPDKKNALAEIGKQHYIAEAGRLFVMVADMQRNASITEAKGISPECFTTTDFFLRALSDTVIAAQNLVIAAESLGLGAVYLGSILNSPQAVIKLLNLPKYTFPVFGVAVGYPDQAPQLKPRLPQSAIYHENSYQVMDKPLNALKDYDQVVHQYYDLRDTNRRVDTFTNQIAKAAANGSTGDRKKTADTLRSQGLLQD